jgi:hypothetical protein
MEEIKKYIKKILRPSYKVAKSAVKFIGWSFPFLLNLIITCKIEKKRVLVIYDTSSQPYSVGDLLNLLEASLVLCEKYNVNIVDIAFVYDPDNPDLSDPIFVGKVNKDNVYFQLASLLPLVQINPLLGSVFVFNSQRQLQHYVVDNVDLYYVWPSGRKIADGEYLTPKIFNELLYPHFKVHRSIPLLSCRPFLQEWAISFFKAYVGNDVPVTVNLRNNKGWHQNRNSKVDVWVSFFKYCETRYPVKFIIICAFSEIDDRLRSCNNVFIAKDYHTSIEQDMALIYSSAIHLGVGSGPATIARFNSKPYLIVNEDYREMPAFRRHLGMIEMIDDKIQRYIFSFPFQHIACEPESVDMLIREFELIWNGVDSLKWQNNTQDITSTFNESNSWLR